MPKIQSSNKILSLPPMHQVITVGAKTITS